MKLFIFILVLAIVLISGCTQQQTPQYQKLTDSDLQILNVKWSWDSSVCNYDNNYNIFVTLRCAKKDIYCEIYLNGVKNTVYDISECNEQEITVADRVSADGKSFWVQDNEDKNIHICCSYRNITTNEIMREYEVCKDTTLKAICPNP